jgi:glycerol-3-phosphate cytidylyltransferase
VGVEVRYFPYTVHTSSTALRRALAALEGPSRAAAVVGDARR